MLSKTLAVAIALFASVAFVSDDGLKRERGGETDAAKDAMEGKAPPKLDMEMWMNVGDKPPTWKSMKGKVVILDFWAYW